MEGRDRAFVRWTGLVLEDNIACWDPRAGTNTAKTKFSGATLDQWRARGHDTNSVLADPMFVDAGKSDFRLRPDSSALKLGFKPFRSNTVGVRAKQDRD